MSHSLHLTGADERLRLSIDSLREGVQVIGSDWRYLYLNRTAAEQGQQTVEALIGRTMMACYPRIEETDLFLCLTRVMTTGQPESLRNEFTYPTGKRRWFDLFVERVPAGICVISLDVTDRQALEVQLRDAEARTRFAMRAAKMGVWQLRLSTGEMQFSESTADLVGIEPGTGPRTLDAFLEWVAPSDREAVRRALARTVGGTSPEFVAQFRTTRADGAQRWMEAHGRVVADEHGAADLLAGVGIDVTDRREAELQFQQAQKMEAIGRLAGGVAHDFNNQITAILGFCDLLLADLGANSPHAKDLGEIRQAAERSSALTRQLLAFSRRQVLRVEPLDLNQVVRRPARMFERLLGEHIQCRLTLSPATLLINGDAGQLESVLTNLAINARDAMPGGGELRMETGTIALSEEDVQQHPAMRPGHYAVLSVTDTGHGMDEATRARVFEPFFTTKPAGVGTGLGLSTVYGVVKQMDGFIWVYSEVGLGTTFRLYFPLSIDQTAPRATPPALVVPNTSAIILVVEDDAAVRQFVVRALDRQPYTVVQADSSERARAILADRPVDLLLTDVRLAGQSGPDFVRSLDQPLRVLYMSGYPDPPGGGDSGLAGQLLQKPFAIPDLLQAVRRALQQPASVPPQMS